MDKTKVCYNCLQDNLYLKQMPNKKWRLFNADGTRHICPKKPFKLKPIKKKQNKVFTY